MQLYIIGEKSRLFQRKMRLNLLFVNLFHDSITKGNNLFPAMKHFVSLGETKCFDCYHTCETMSYLLRRCYLNEAKTWFLRPLRKVT